MNRHQLAEQRSKVLHRKIAAKLREHPNLWRIPWQNLQRWEKQMQQLPPALVEWRQILQTMPREEILMLLESDSEESVRLRSSSPFTGILTEVERQHIQIRQ